MPKATTTKNSKASKPDIFTGSFAATLTKGHKHGPVKDGNYVRLDSGLQVSARKGGYCLIEGLPAEVKTPGLKVVEKPDVKSRRRVMVTESQLDAGKKAIADFDAFVKQTQATAKAHVASIKAKQGKGKSAVKVTRVKPRPRTKPVPVTAA